MGHSDLTRRAAIRLAIAGTAAAAIGAAVVVDGNTLRLRPAETGADGMTAAPGPVVPQAKVYSTDRL